MRRASRPRVPAGANIGLTRAPCSAGAVSPKCRRDNGNAILTNRWFILGVLVAARVAMGYQYQTIASAAPPLRDALGIGFTEIGTLIGLYHISGVVLSLPSGLIVARVGDKRLCAIGLALMAVGGLVVSAAHRYEVAFLGRLVSGMGGILFNLVITKMTADWFARREIVLAMAIILATWPFGIALGLVTQPLAVAAFGWRAMMLISALACLASLLLVAAFYRVPETEAGDPVEETASGLPPGRTLAPVIVAGFMWGAFNAGLIGYFSFVPLFLTGRGDLTLAAAGASTSLALWVAMVAIPFGGFLAQRLNRPGATIPLSCGATAAVMVGIVVGVPPWLACPLFGLAMGPSPGILTALPLRVLPAAFRAPGLGVFYTCHFLMQSTGPMIIGWVRDHAGGEAAVLYAAAMFVSVPVLLAGFEILARRRA
jgi:predicted MFS family arabinose efflux permease